MSCKYQLFTLRNSYDWAYANIVLRVKTCYK